MGAKRLFSLVTELFVSQWTTPLNELMSRSGSSLETNPRIFPISYQPLRRCLCKSIREGTFTPVKTPTPGLSRMTSSEANVRRVKDILEVNPRMSVRETLDNLSLPRLTDHRILKAHFMFRNVYSVWVPHVLSDDNKR